MAIATETVTATTNADKTAFEANKYRQPLKLQGALDQYESFDVTPVIGKEFPTASLKQWLKAPSSDELLRDLAITVSQRGVVFFRRQDGLDNDLQKQLVQRLGELSGKPSTSKLHIHPVSNSGRRLGGKDDEISVISSEQAKELYEDRYNRKQSSKEGWHSDIRFEPVPSYELFDRISPAYREFLESLTATYAQPIFQESARRHNFQLYGGQRGAPENVGTDVKAVHPVIRTNPVTGWKSVFAVGQHAQRINEVSEAESARLLAWFLDLIVENHDLQVRYRWQNQNDLAVWDNRSVYHTATYDYEGLGPRTGQRAVSLGERPYLDPESTMRREALAKTG